MDAGKKKKDEKGAFSFSSETQYMNKIPIDREDDLKLTQSGARESMNLGEKGRD